MNYVLRYNSHYEIFSHDFKIPHVVAFFVVIEKLRQPDLIFVCFFASKMKTNEALILPKVPKKMGELK